MRDALVAAAEIAGDDHRRVGRAVRREDGAWRGRAGRVRRSERGL